MLWVADILKRLANHYIESVHKIYDHECYNWNRREYVEFTAVSHSQLVAQNECSEQAKYSAKEHVERKRAASTYEAIHDKPTGAKKTHAVAETSAALAIPVTAASVTHVENLTCPYNKMCGFDMSKTCSWVLKVMVKSVL